MNGLPEAIFRPWIHSFEEDTGDIQVFRPEEYPFPLARGRGGLEFSHDGAFIDWTVGPADAPRGSQGRWKAEAMGRVSVRLPDKGVKRTFEVLECNETILKLRKC